MTVKMKKERLDQLLVSSGLVASREQARRLILAGKVRIGDVPATKAGQLVEEHAALRVLEPEHEFVGRGGMKLAHALGYFGIQVQGKVCLDAGASTGGFTDCLLKSGARTVFAIDVGYGQLAWTLRNDPRVVVMERTNLRTVTPEQIGEAVDLVTLDLSFISVAKVFPALPALMAKPSQLVVLIKPQFEVGRERVGKGGIVRDVAARDAAVAQVIAAAHAMQWQHVGTVESPVTGADGNVEYLAAFNVVG